MTELQHQTFPQERALYAARDLRLSQCTFEGAEDGESALKEAARIDATHCHFALRYPLWHGTDIRLHECTLAPTCRAALWYAHKVDIEHSRLHGIKALRECQQVSLRNCSVLSEEFGWKSRALSFEHTSVEGEYLFLDSQEITFRNSSLTGKYSFQYVQNACIEHSTLNTKDAFWHSRNVTVRDSILRGEYLGWYSENLTLERCHIVGTQPLCYARGLTLRNCTTENCDLAFEYSEVHASIQGHILSVKNPRSGSIRADSIGEILFTNDTVVPCNADVAANA